MTSRLSVTLVDQDHIRWKSWKLIARTITPTPWLFVAQTPSTYSRGTMGNFEETRGGVRKSGVWSTKAVISLKRIKIEEKLLWGPIGTHQRSFERYHPRPPTAFSSQDWGLQPHPKLQSLLSQEGVKLYGLQNSNLAGTFKWSIRTKAH